MKIKMTDAFRKVDKYRDEIEKGSSQYRSKVSKILAKNLSGVVYQYFDKLERPCLVAYKGRSKKPYFRYYYNKIEDRNQKAITFFEEMMKGSERAKRQVRALEVGDVLKASWGYDQTNYNYYLVLKLVGKESVSIIEIGAQSESTGHMTSESVPNINKFIGEPMTRRVNGDSVRVCSVIFASKAEYTKVGMVKVYRTDHYSSYA